jgi:protein gp37
VSEQTHIAWCDSTVNFWEGCTKVSPGCSNCYAEARDKRFTGGIYWRLGRRRKSKSAVNQALNMNRKPWICDDCGNAQPFDGRCEKCFDEFEGKIVHTHVRRIFSLSLGDWLDDEVPIQWLAEMLDTIRRCDQVSWILCSKRWGKFKGRLNVVCRFCEDNHDFPNEEELWAWCLNWCAPLGPQDIPPNIIGLCSVEDQQRADERIPQFLKVPLACRGLSLEPLLGSVDLDPHWLGAGGRSGDNYQQPQIHWLIAGGESGPSARPCNVDWIRSLVKQGQAAGVATFVKQLGAKPQTVEDTGCGLVHPWPMNLRDKKGGDPSEWPEDLRVQEWPKDFEL